MAKGFITTLQLVPAHIIPGFRQAIGTKGVISSKKMDLMYKIGRADEVPSACYLFRYVLTSRADVFLKQAA